MYPSYTVFSQRPLTTRGQLVPVGGSEKRRELELRGECGLDQREWSISDGSDVDPNTLRPPLAQFTCLDRLASRIASRRRRHQVLGFRERDLHWGLETRAVFEFLPNRCGFEPQNHCVHQIRPCLQVLPVVAAV